MVSAQKGHVFEPPTTVASTDFIASAGCGRRWRYFMRRLAALLASRSGLEPENSNTVDRFNPLPSTHRTATHHSLIFFFLGAARANTPSATMRLAVSRCAICDLSSNATSSIELRGILPSSFPPITANTKWLGATTHSTLLVMRLQLSSPIRYLPTPKCVSAPYFLRRASDCRQ